MSDEKALLGAIWEHPHEDTPRLMYADWLQEQGAPAQVARAEFIRVQCELARLGEWDESPRRADLEKREKRLWAKHAKAWKEGLSPFLQKLSGFVRGFPAPPPRAAPVPKFLKLTADDFAGAPLWSYNLPPSHKLLAQFLASPLVSRVGTLGFNYWLESAADVARFVASPNVRNLADLSIGSSRCGDAGIAELAAHAAALPHVHRLNLEGCDLSVRAIEALAASPLANRLRSLHLFMNALGSDGVLALARAPALTHLERLDIRHCEGYGAKAQPITREAIVTLCASPHLGALKDLALDPNRFGDEGVRMMCATRPVFRLAALRVYSVLSKIGDAGAEALAAWPALADVRVLHLQVNSIGRAGAVALARSPYLNRITELQLNLNPLADDPTAVAALRERFGSAVHAASLR